MKEEHEFLMPDYYTEFSCKTGACRATCCVGWPISVSMQNYFRLLGMSCPRSLRERLDRGLRIVDRPTEEEYARFEPNYEGNCPLRAEDGKCSLHAALGEDALPDICRLYPRGLRITDGGYECSCANSCEAVLELLIDRREPISFLRRTVSVKMPPQPKRGEAFETMGTEESMRLRFLSVIQNRTLPLPKRILQLGAVMDQTDRALVAHDEGALRVALTAALPTAASDGAGEVTAEHLTFGLRIIRRIVEILDGHSRSIRTCGEAALAYFGEGESALARYGVARTHFETVVPHWETFYENMLVNHMFFSEFPFQDRPESLRDEYLALCAVYALLRFLGLGCMAERQEREALIDGMAAVFRLVDHTEFDRYAAHLLKSMQCTSREALSDLLSL